MKQRIQKVLANAGVASRRNIEEMVQQGRVTVNGKVVTELPVMVDPEKDRVKVDDESVPLKGSKTVKRYYFLLNKPRGVICSNVSQGEQLRAVDLLPPTLDARLFPVGRLDSESKGLLLLTNDGELTNQLTHPRYGVAKTYQAVVDGRVDGREMETMYKGIWLADKSGHGFKTGPVKIKALTRTHVRSVLEITLREGRNREVRRMLAAVGHKVRDLTRVRMGPLTLEHLPLGACRQLSEKEVRALRRAVTEAQEQSMRVKDKPAGEDEVIIEVDGETTVEPTPVTPPTASGPAAGFRPFGKTRSKGVGPVRIISKAPRSLGKDNGSSGQASTGQGSQRQASTGQGLTGKSFGARSFGGSRSGGASSSGPRSSGPRSSGPRSSGPRSNGPRPSGPRPLGKGPRPTGPRQMGSRPNGPSAGKPSRPAGAGGNFARPASKPTPKPAPKRGKFPGA